MNKLMPNILPFLFAIVLFLLSPKVFNGQEIFTSKQVATWQNIKGFALNESENFAVFEMLAGEKQMLFASRKENGIWTEPVPIAEINDYMGGATIVGGPFFGYKDEELYYHANFPDSKGNCDIYVSLWEDGKWSAPKNIGEPVNSIENEESPSLTAAGDKIFFTRKTLAPKTERDEKQMPCKTIYFALINKNNEWEMVQAMTEPINLDCEATPFIAADGKTLYFSSVRNKAESFDLYFTREVMKGSWMLPMPVAGTGSENDDFDPEFHKGLVYHLSSFTKRKIYSGIWYNHIVPDDMVPLEMANICGTIKDVNGKPLQAGIEVVDPITSKFIGKFVSDPKSGRFSIPLLTKNTYLFLVRQQAYSFASFEKDLGSGSKADTAPVHISLFNTIRLVMSVFDSEIFKPLEALFNITDTLTKENLTVKTTPAGQGRYSLELPIGKNYKIVASAEGFESNGFDFSLLDDIIFSEFERNLALTPKKKEFIINVSDFETQADVAAEIVIYNLDRDETIVLTAEDIKDGKAAIMLREGDKYEFNIKGPKGYAFFNSTVDLKSETEKRTLDVELKPLKAKTSITLNNISFGPNSADLDELSFAELGRAVMLIQDNPSILVEISAHTDDVGSERYNLKLSERRAESVVSYLVEKGVSVERLVAKGYGESMPLVPNNSEENKTINRRVEFKIIGFTEETNPQE